MDSHLFPEHHRLVWPECPHRIPGPTLQRILQGLDTGQHVEYGAPVLTIRLSFSELHIRIFSH